MATILASDNVQVLHHGLRRFTISCSRIVKALVDSKVSAEADLLRDYLHLSPDASDLFRIWDWLQEHQISKLETYIPTILSYLIPAARMVMDSKSAAITIAKQVPHPSYMKCIQRGLASGKHNVEQAMLKLLVAVTSAGVLVAKDVFANFHFNMKLLPSFLEVRRWQASTEKTLPQLKRVEDVRTLYIEFILAFLEHGDGTVKKAILETKDLVSSIVKVLSTDSYQMVDHVLTVFRRDLFDSKDIPRSVKTAFFNNHILEQLSKLYTRKEIIPDQTSTIAHLAHQFFRHICTNPGTGICSPTNGWYPARIEDLVTVIHSTAFGSAPKNPIGTIQNKTLSRFLTCLKPAQDPLQAQLVLDIFQACPELVSVYWHSTSIPAFDPRPSSKWLGLMSLTTKIISLPIPQFDSSVPPPVITTCNNILPPPFSRTFISRGLQHAISVVRYTTAAVLALSLHKLGAIQDMARKSAELGSPTLWKDWMNAIHDEIRTRIPDFQTVIKMHHEATCNLPVKVDALGDVSIDAEEEASKRLLCISLKLFREYGNQLPGVVAESRFDYGKLVPNDLSVLPADLAQALIAVLCDVPSSFKWWHKASANSNTSNNNREISYLAIFLNLYIHPDIPQPVKQSTRRLLGNLLTNCFLFQNHSTEASILISCLDELSTSQQANAVKYIDMALGQGMKDMYPVAELFQETIQNAESGMSAIELRSSGAKGRDAGKLPVAPGVVCLASYYGSGVDHAGQSNGHSEDDFLVLYMTKVFRLTQSCVSYMIEIIKLIKDENVKIRLTQMIEPYRENGMDIDMILPAKKKSKTSHASVSNTTSDGLPDVMDTSANVAENVPSEIRSPPDIATEVKVHHDLLQSLLQNPSRNCKIGHVPTLIEAYKATTGASDLVIREIFELYESSGISLSSNLLNWSPTGSWMSGLDGALMDKSIRHFNVTNVYSDGDAVMYDPLFVLSAMAAQVEEGPLTELRRVVECGAAGFAVMCLCSLDESLRQIAGYALSGFREALEGASFKEVDQIKLVLDGLRNAIPNESYRVCSISALFVALSLPIMLAPANKLFPLVNKFWLQRAIVDLEDIPMFYELFFSASDDCRKERAWMLRLLVNGLKTEADYNVYRKRHVFDHLFGYFSSPVCDANSQKLILELLNRTTSFPSVVKELVYKSGLTSFIHALVMMPQLLRSPASSSPLIPNVLKNVMGCIDEPRMVFMPTVLTLEVKEHM
ncbi:hypothetical protein SeMB42_g07051 [Synchytrium endobioticum]|uniref:Nucleolar pre-ribosomal-associated protein 1 C-terminal domain-containing protein n=1 Tax=Synchytrium endobioticum TaxID=286115 RepID=A0A507CBS9_9FUNG|nr:hypothetical protein SeMB42_g07051 [Synchytrium endobioticum]